MVNEDAKDNIEQRKGTNEKEGDLYRVQWLETESIKERHDEVEAK